jgi:tellurite methyltransferase
MRLSISQMLNDPTGLIDLRTPDDFMEHHVRGSCSLPWERLPQSMHELPANHIPIALIGDIHQLNNAEQFLLSKSYQVISTHLDGDSFWQQIRKDDLLDSGCNSLPLWQANPLLVESIRQIEKVVTGRSVVDIACGAGRDSVYLAKRGWQVTGIDNKPSALERCSQLAQSNQVKVNTQLKELELGNNPFAGLTADLVVVMRYLHRPLFKAIHHLINPGGVLIYSTFMVGCEKMGSPRNPNYLLLTGELAEEFASYEILIDEQRTLLDGRPVALFVAKKNR